MDKIIDNATQIIFEVLNRTKGNRISDESIKQLRTAYNDLNDLWIKLGSWEKEGEKICKDLI